MSAPRFTLGLLAGLAAASGPQLQVTGGALAWKVETPYFIVDFAKNPGTGRSGQINTVFLKDPGILLTRDRPTSTLHLSPNAAAGGPWNGINRWDPPARHAVSADPSRFRLEREGPMPNIPVLQVKTAYEILAGRPAIAVEESVEAAADARVSLLRLAEWSFAPGAGNPFSHFGWEDARGQVSWRRKEKEESLPLDLRWQAFWSETRAFGVAAVVERLDIADRSALKDPCARFGGDPHYFYRVLVSSGSGPLMTIPRGSRFAIRYWVYFFQARDAARAAASASAFYRSLHEKSR